MAWASGLIPERSIPRQIALYHSIDHADAIFAAEATSFFYFHIIDKRRYTKVQPLYQHQRKPPANSLRQSNR